MSVKVMGLVWDVDLPPNEKYVLLAYADHADHQGRNIYPAIRTVARKTGYGPRNVQYMTRRLEERGLLIPDGVGPQNVNRWRIPLDELAGGAKFAGVQIATDRGAKSAPKPSYKPSLKQEEEGATQNIYTLYENVVGPINSLISDELKDAEERFHWEWIVEAFKEAVFKNARNWKYIYAILDRWEREGFQTDNRPKKKTKERDYDKAGDDFLALVEARDES